MQALNSSKHFNSYFVLVKKVIHLQSLSKVMQRMHSVAVLKDFNGTQGNCGL